DLVMRSGDGTILAAAPTISTRRVQTYGRIPNNTPLIIGGLVAREEMVRQDKVPLLGDLPLIGFAFRSERKDRMKREVIIVLTPHVLPENKEARRSLPKDENLFDSFGNDLFRDSYRIRNEDVFDLTFLLENRRIVTYRDLARQAAQKNFRLAAVEPFRGFVRDSVPGESILVTRMIYEVIKRLDVARVIETSRIIYFEGQQVGGYNVKYLEQLLQDRTKDGVTDFGAQALAITYRYDRASLEEGRLGSEPIPEIKLVDCPNRKAWGQFLWELNQPTPDGQQQHTILIQNDSDIVRLSRALVLKRVAVLNGGTDEMRLKNFSVGKVLLMPELKRGQIHVLDADTAMYFFHTEHYYAATLAEIEKQLKELDRALRRPEIRLLLETD
ncbi:MAG: type II and III secretion system protein, partial [Planctomycetes bacterium]|nr:type II and III secretion system protein [Planctomycetota bacterium]